ncbi:hypothetical protein [Amycolatopsis sp. FDAARGOS 1241]|uniref:hypothetical protein n=1 Tax=Amycolatopsis sp. FDAARGOS 1241 TaxID=2778070 RepID=UPI001EF1DCC9|nr:hypothetical protein [Amycolatopsis sp. FDAARGOS 1241]
MQTYCDGVGFSIHDYAHAAGVLAVHAQRLVRQQPTARRFATAAVIADYLRGAARLGWPQAHRDRLRDAYRSVLDRDDWRAVIRRAVSAGHEHLERDCCAGSPPRSDHGCVCERFSADCVPAACFHKISTGPPSGERIGAPSIGPVEWLTEFTADAERRRVRPEPAWGCGARLDALVVRSLQRFQVGESGDGVNLIAKAQPRYREAVRLFVAEEQNHARLLAELLKAAGSTTIREHWSDTAFVWLRRALGLRLELMVLLIAEVVALSYYRGAEGRHRRHSHARSRGTHPGRRGAARAVPV